MELIMESIIMNKENYIEKIQELINSIGVSNYFIEEDTNGCSKFKKVLEQVKSLDKFEDIVKKILNEAIREYNYCNNTSKIDIIKYNNEYLVILGIALDSRLVVDYNLEYALHNAKDDMIVKIKKGNDFYDLDCGYGVYHEEYFLVATNETIRDKCKITNSTVGKLSHIIEYQQEDMKEEDYEVCGTYFLCIDNEADYKSWDYYSNKNINAHEINKCYIKDNTLFIELED